MSLLATVSLIVQRVFRLAYDGWFAIVGAFSWVLAHVATFVVFVVGFVPYGVVVRLTAMDPLDRAFDDAADSYWEEDPSQNETLEDFRRQY